MDEELESWISEMLKKGTFSNYDDAIEFCVGATKTFCEYDGLTQASIKKAKEEKKEDVRSMAVIDLINFPLKWSKELGMALKGSVNGTAKGDVRNVLPTNLKKKK